MQKNSFLVPLIALSLIALPNFLHSRVQAASPTPSASVGSATINEVTDNLKKRLQESLGGDLSEPLSPARAYVGIVKDIIKDTLILEDKDGKRDVKLSDETTILRSPGNKVIKSDNIILGDNIIAMGYPGEGDNLTGKRLIVSSTAIIPPAKTTSLGIVLELGRNQLTLDIEGEEQIVYYTAKTVFKSPAAETFESDELAVGDALIFTALIDKDEDYTATQIMRISSTIQAE